jgi:hypothetical protein
LHSNYPEDFAHYGGKTSKLYAWHFLSGNNRTSEFVRGEGTNLGSWETCIYIFGLCRISQYPQSVLITPPWAFDYLFNKTAKTATVWKQNVEQISQESWEVYIELVTLSCLPYDQWHTLVKCDTWAGSHSGYRKKKLCLY